MKKFEFTIDLTAEQKAVVEKIIAEENDFINSEVSEDDIVRYIKHLVFKEISYYENFF